MKYLNEEYRDRGKMKWAGFYLSEHSSEQEKLKATRESVNEPKEKMSLPKIGEVLKQPAKKSHFYLRSFLSSLQCRTLR